MTQWARTTKRRNLIVAFDGTKEPDAAAAVRPSPSVAEAAAYLAAFKQRAAYTRKSYTLRTLAQEKGITGSLSTLLAPT